jgi:glyoxylase-like metal-dependent hydrolase (beta-lactamase superfamily II)
MAHPAAVSREYLFMIDNRRDFLRVLLGGAAGLSLTVTSRALGQAAGQGGPPPTPITAKKLTDRIVVLSGAGGNVGLVIAPEGGLMIDGGLPNRAGDLAKAVADIIRRPVQVLFNTHYHGDHVGSNELLGKNKVRIIAHTNVKKRLGERIESQAFGRTIEPLSATGQPTETFPVGGKLTFGREAVQYTHVPLAHTDGDAWVFFPQANILHTGDLLFIERYPVVDFTVGGSLAGMTAALDRVVRAVDKTTQIIPGHGPVVTIKELLATRQMWAALNQRLEMMAKEGRTVDEVVKAAPTKDFDAKVGPQAAQTSEGFLRQAYGGVLARQKRG